MAFRYQRFCLMWTLFVSFALAGCGGTIKVYNEPSEDPIVIGPQSRPTVSVYVLPRLGLFDDLLYQNRQQYLDRVGDAQVTKYAAPASDWVAVFPKPKVSNDCVRTLEPKERTLCGNLKTRQVALTASGFDHPSSCTWQLEGQTIPRQPCTREYSVHSNGRIGGKVTIHMPGGDKEVAFEIPADKLIVVLGDSYASGEGNPDAPVSKPRFAGNSDNPLEEGPRQLDNSAVWMSERCHRSLWASPMRAGLGMAAATKTSNNEVLIQTSGAVTVISTACSGAELRHLIDPKDLKDLLPSDREPGYQGRETFVEMQMLHKQFGHWSELPLFRSGEPTQWDRLKPQVQEVADLLDTTSPSELEAAIISIGGNDIGFGDLITEMLMTKDKKDSPASSEAAKQDIAARISKLSGRFQALFKQIDDKLNPTNVYLMAYPDPTRLMAPSNQHPDPGYCSCDIGDFMGLGFLERKTICMSEKENRFASNEVVYALNRQLATVAERQGWYFVHGLEGEPFLAGVTEPAVKLHLPHALPDFDTHAWCAQRDQRWLRTHADATALQGLLPDRAIPFSSGAMHPTANAHEKYMSILNAAMTRRGQTPTFNITPSASADDGTTLYVAKHVQLTWSDSTIAQPSNDAVFDKTFYPDVFTFNAKYGSKTLCSGARSSTAYLQAPRRCELHVEAKRLDIDLSSVATDGPFDLQLTLRDVTLKRLAAKQAQKLEVDTMAPTFECSVQLGTLRIPCDDPSVNTTVFEGAPELVLTARDDKSGFGFWNCEGESCLPAQENQTVMRWQLPEDGSPIPSISVNPVDKVGNRGGKFTPFASIIVHIAPALHVSDAGR
jgi:hypothetical protein